MAVNSLNKEGLTFREWVCAAGEARFGYLCSEGVFPYTISENYYIEHDKEFYAKGGCFTDRRGCKRVSSRFYPLKIRKAWLNGEDPTEWKTPNRTIICQKT